MEQHDEYFGEAAMTAWFGATARREAAVPLLGDRPRKCRVLTKRKWKPWFKEVFWYLRRSAPINSLQTNLDEQKMNGFSVQRHFCALPLGADDRFTIYASPTVHSSRSFMNPLENTAPSCCLTFQTPWTTFSICSREWRSSAYHGDDKIKPRRSQSGTVKLRLSLAMYHDLQALKNMMNYIKTISFSLKKPDKIIIEASKHSVLQPTK